jgi:hypothetical protein
VKESVRLAQIFSLILMIYALPLIVFGVGVLIAVALGWYAVQAHTVISSWQPGRHLSKKDAQRYDQSVFLAIAAAVLELVLYRNSRHGWIIVLIGLIFLIIGVRGRRL